MVRDSSCTEGRISWFLSRYGGKIWVPLELQQGPQGPSRVASEKSGLFSSCQGHFGIPLEVLPVNRAVSNVQLVNSVFLSSGNRDLGPPVRLQLGSLVLRHGTLLSSQVVKGLSGLLLSSRGEFGLFQRISRRVRPPSICDGVLQIVPLDPLKGYQDLSRAERDLGVLFPCSRIHGVPLEIQ